MNETTMYDVLVIGDYFFDQVFDGLVEFPELGREVYSKGMTTTGGGMFNSTLALHRLGVKVGWPVYFGNDAYSHFVRDLSAEAGIDLSLAHHANHPYRRVTTSMPLHFDRAFVTYIDPEPPSLFAHWLHMVETQTYKHLHIGGMLPTEQLNPLVAAARANGAEISIDCQDTPMLKQPCACRDFLSQVDIFLPNAREACIVAEEATVAAALECLMDACEMVIIKDGAKGAWLGYKDSTALIGGIDVGKCIDSTGAGDCFNAGFLYGRLVEDAAPETCIRYGNICGGVSVTNVGGGESAPTLAEMTTWLDKYAHP